MSHLCGHGSGINLRSSTVLAVSNFPTYWHLLWATHRILSRSSLHLSIFFKVMFAKQPGQTQQSKNPYLKTSNASRTCSCVFQTEVWIYSLQCFLSPLFAIPRLYDRSEGQSMWCVGKLRFLEDLIINPWQSAVKMRHVALVFENLSKIDHYF